MRTLFVVCLLFVAMLGLVPATTGVAADAEQRAQELDKSLQAVEWYTNEMVRKALQAEVDNDLVNAETLGDKAIESDLKAQGLRAQTALAWQEAGKPARAQEAWHRAADMAGERAVMLAKRLPPLLARWQEAQRKQDVARQREQQLLYVQGLYLTAQQWALAAQFLENAGDEDGRASVRSELASLVAQLRIPENTALLQQDRRLAGSIAQLAQWQALPGTAP